MAAAVPFALKAAPWIASGVGSLLGKKASGPSKGQQTAMDATAQAGQQVGQYAAPLMNQGLSMTREGGADMGAAAQYYKNILTSRRGANESLAPEMATVMDYYKGAEGKADRTLRGGSRDYAVAELDRQKVGNMAMMLPQARATAAQGLGALGGQRASVGTSMTGQGTNAASNAAYINSQGFNQATQVRDQAQEGGSAWGKFFGGLVNAIPLGGGQKKLPTLPQYQPGNQLPNPFGR